MSPYLTAVIILNLMFSLLQTNVLKQPYNVKHFKITHQDLQDYFGQEQ